MRQTFLKKISHPTLLLAAVTLLAALLRFFMLGRWSFWIDEIYTLTRAQSYYPDFLTVLQRLPSTQWLPLSLLLVKLTTDGLGVTEWSARLVPALIGMLSIPLLYLFGRKLAGVRVGIIFALLLAVSPWHLYWSQNARFYTTLMLLYFVSALIFYWSFEHNKPVLIPVFYLVFYFTLSERLTAAFLMPVLLAYLALLPLMRFKKPSGYRAKLLLLFLGPILLIGLVDLVRWIASGQSFLYDAFDGFFGMRVRDPFRLAVAIIFNLGLPVIALGFAGGLSLIRQKNRLGLFLFLSAVLPAAALLILNLFMFTKDRYVFVTLPAWLLLVAIAIDRLFAEMKGYGKFLAAGILLIFLAQFAGENLLYYHVNHGGRLEWKTAFQTMQNGSQAEDRFVAFWPEFGDFYADRDILPWKDIRPGDVLTSGRTFWFLVDNETLWNNAEMVYWVKENAELVEVWSLRKPEEDFYLRLYRYQPAAP